MHKRQVGGKRLEKDVEDFYKRGICCNPYVFLCSNIVDSTFHPADCRGRLQTIRQFRRSDFRRSTQACFPLFIHSGINYPPAAGWSPFLSRKELRFASFPFLSFGILAFYKNAIRRIRLQIGFANLLLQPLTFYLSFMHRPENLFRILADL